MIGFKTVKTSDDKYWMINFSGHDELGDLSNFTSSYHVLDARLLGLSYPDYLRYSQANHAKLRGRHGYSYPVWQNQKDAQIMCDKLNKEWNKLIKAIDFN